MALPSWMYQPNKCDCFGGYCVRRMCPHKSKRDTYYKRPKKNKRKPEILTWHPEDNGGDNGRER